MGSRFIVKDNGVTPVMWVVGLGMVLIATLATGALVYWARRRRRAVEADEHDDDDASVPVREVAEA